MKSMQNFFSSIIYFDFSYTYKIQIQYVQEVVTHFIYCKLVYEMGHYFLDTQYNKMRSSALLFFKTQR